MAITNMPYDDARILDGVTAAPIISTETRDVQVDFASSSTRVGDVARITATITWTVSAADAVRILDEARPAAPEGDARS
jgi:hypothetical protein